MLRVRAFNLGTLALCALALVAGCTRSIEGQAVSIYDNPFQVAGLPTTSGPNGPRADVPPTELEVDNGDGGEIDTLALDAVTDVQAYWEQHFDAEFDGEFEPVDALVSWSARSSRRKSVEFCTESTYRMVNAAYCRLDNSIGWDRELLLPTLADTFGDMAVVMVIAHEYGHAIQNNANLVERDDPVIVKEQQADCFAGAYMRWVAEGQSEYFTLNTSDGLNTVLAATVAIRDSDPDDPDSVHGSAFERVTAVQVGFTDGAKGCKSIDMDEIEQRRGDLPQSFQGVSGDFTITQDSLVELGKALKAILPTPQPPEYVYRQSACEDGSSTGPVTYCPGQNTVATDVDGLAERGRVDKSNDSLSPKVTGDFNGYVVFISRYTLAVQQDRRQDLTGAKAGLRTACLAGVATGKLAEPGRAEGDITLAAGDLDEAVSGLLADGLAASDVTGQTVPSGFARVDAFRAGVLGGDDTCTARYEN